MFANKFSLPHFIFKNISIVVTMIFVFTSKPFIYFLTLISFIISILLLQVKSTLEFQTPLVNFYIQLIFCVSVTVLFLTLPFYAVKRKYKKLLWIIASPFIVIWGIFGIPITLLMQGHSFKDKSYFVNHTDKNVIVYEQYLDEGGLGGTLRKIKAKEIFPGVRSFYELTDEEMVGTWDKYDMNGIFEYEVKYPRNQGIYLDLEGEIEVIPRKFPKSDF